MVNRTSRREGTTVVFCAICEHFLQLHMSTILHFIQFLNYSEDVYCDCFQALLWAAPLSRRLKVFGCGVCRTLVNQATLWCCWTLRDLGMLTRWLYSNRVLHRIFLLNVCNYKLSKLNNDNNKSFLNNIYMLDDLHSGLLIYCAILWLPTTEKILLEASEYKESFISIKKIIYFY